MGQHGQETSEVQPNLPLFVRKLPTWDSLGWIQLVNTNTNRHPSGGFKPTV